MLCKICGFQGGDYEERRLLRLLRRVALVRADVSEENTVFIKAICSSETSVLTRATRRYIPEGGILQL
jgi:hypothetical protein